jgi:hypothetical protein
MKKFNNKILENKMLNVSSNDQGKLFGGFLALNNYIHTDNYFLLNEGCKNAENCKGTENSLCTNKQICFSSNY